MLEYIKCTPVFHEDKIKTFQRIPVFIYVRTYSQILIMDFKYQSRKNLTEKYLFSLVHSFVDWKQCILKYL